MHVLHRTVCIYQIRLCVYVLGRTAYVRVYTTYDCMCICTRQMCRLHGCMQQVGLHVCMYWMHCVCVAGGTVCVYVLPKRAHCVWICTRQDCVHVQQVGLGACKQVLYRWTRQHAYVQGRPLCVDTLDRTLCVYILLCVCVCIRMLCVYVLDRTACVCVCVCTRHDCICVNVLVRILYVVGRTLCAYVLDRQTACVYEGVYQIGLQGFCSSPA